MKRILSVLLLTFALAWAAGAQRVNAEIGLYYQNGQYDTVKDNFIGASILAPALARLGLDALTAHLFVFYFACLSAITPPVALAAYAGAGIAKCDPMKTAVNACKIGFAGFIVPFVFCYNSAMNLNGSLGEILLVVFTALVG